MIVEDRVGLLERVSVDVIVIVAVVLELADALIVTVFVGVDDCDLVSEIVVDDDTETLGAGNMMPVNTSADGVFRAVFAPSPSCTHQIRPRFNMQWQLTCTNITCLSSDIKAPASHAA